MVDSSIRNIEGIITNVFVSANSEYISIQNGKLIFIADLLPSCFSLFKGEYMITNICYVYSLQSCKRNDYGRNALRSFDIKWYNDFIQGRVIIALVKKIGSVL